MKKPNPHSFRNRRKFEIEEAKYNDGTYQAIRIFAKNTKVMVIQQVGAMKKGYMDLEYERDGEPSVLSDHRVEFFALNFDVRDRIYFIRAELLRVKARRHLKLNGHKTKKGVKYVRVPIEELIRWD